MAKDVKPKEGVSTRLVTKDEFAQRVYRAMAARGWRQSDLHRHSGLGRDSISNYIKGKSFATPHSLERLARALGVEPEDLMPGHSATSRIDEKTGFSLKEDPQDARYCFVKLDKRILFTTALKVGELIREDDVANAE